MEQLNFYDLFMPVEDKSVGDIVGTEEWKAHLREAVEKAREAVEKEFWLQFRIGKCKIPDLLQSTLDKRL